MRTKNEITADLDKLYSELEQWAKEHNQAVYISGPAYGMGGTFDPSFSSSEDEEYAGWRASSHNC